MTRVLVVEDSPTQAEELRLTLEAEGFEVEVAADGEAGNEQFNESVFDLVLSDILMPGPSGYDLCRRLKATPRGKEVPVVLLTTLGDPMDIIEGLECGADNFVTKPYSAEHLVDRIRGLLTNRAIRAERKLRTGIEVLFMGKRFTISSDREQILDLLISTFEDIVRTNRELQARQEELARLQDQLERKVEERTAALQAEIRQRELVEATLRRSEERYRTLAEAAHDEIFVVNRGGRVEYLNSSAAKRHGKPLDQLLGRSIELLFPPAQAAQLSASLRHVLATGEKHYTEERLTFPSGEAWFGTWVVPIKNDTGEVTAILGVARDITERRNLEEQFRQVQKLDAVGRLAGGIAHDFNNLLTAILGYTSLLLDQLGDEHPSRVDVEEIRKAGERATSLTQQLLAFGRKQIVQPAVLDLNAVVRDFDKMLRRLIGEDIELNTILAGDLAPVRMDPGQVQQVLLNLIVNARDAMPGGGKLTIETANVELDEAYAREHVSVVPGQYVMLAVSDTGCGMDAETQAHVFEPFFTTKGMGKGTGLGLATVYGIVKQSGGNIWVYSEPNRGATFKIYLPRVEEAVGRQEPKAVKERVGGSETVLLVEDEERVRALARRVLTRSGYTVLEAPDGDQALRVAQGHTGPIHLLLTDVVMPGLSGRELAERLASQRPGMRVLYFSGYTDNAIVHHGVLAPGLAFLQKPFTPDALARMVREVLDR